MTNPAELVPIVREVTDVRIMYRSSPVTVVALVRAYTDETDRVTEAYIRDADLAALAAADGRTAWDERDVLAFLSDEANVDAALGIPGKPVALAERGAADAASRYLPGGDPLELPPAS